MASGDRIKIIGGTEFLDYNAINTSAEKLGSDIPEGSTLIELTGKGIITNFKLNVMNRASGRYNYGFKVVIDGQVFHEQVDVHISSNTTVSLFGIETIIPFTENFIISGYMERAASSGSGNNGFKADLIYLI